MRIEGLGPLGQPEPKDKKTEKPQKPVNTALDKVDIKSSNDKIADAGYGKNIKNAKIAQEEQQGDINSKIRHRASSGYYDNPAIVQATSDKLLDSQELTDITKQFHQSQKVDNVDSGTTKIRNEKVAEVRKKLARGFYNDPANFRLFAQKIMDRFGL